MWKRREDHTVGTRDIERVITRKHPLHRTTCCWWLIDGAYVPHTHTHTRTDTHSHPLFLNPSTPSASLLLTTSLPAFSYIITGSTNIHHREECNCSTTTRLANNLLFQNRVLGFKCKYGRRVYICGLLATKPEFVVHVIILCLSNFACCVWSLLF